MMICRSCAAPIEWALTAKGRRIPLDAHPVPDGNILLELVEENRLPIARVLSADEREALRKETEADGRELRLWISHFATCPNAEAHRRNPRPDPDLLIE